MSNTNSMDTSEKMKALEAARLQIEKQFGQGAIMKLGDKANAAGIEVIPSGSILLDEALGIGGYPRGRVIEMYGPESSGKTTLALHAIAEAQKLGGVAAFVDAEHALHLRMLQLLQASELLRLHEVQALFFQSFQDRTFQ